MLIFSGLFVFPDYADRLKTKFYNQLGSAGISKAWQALTDFRFHKLRHNTNENCASTGSEFETSPGHSLRQIWTRNFGYWSGS
jgi:hypothetical protein